MVHFRSLVANAQGGPGKSAVDAMLDRRLAHIQQQVASGGGIIVGEGGSMISDPRIAADAPGASPAPAEL